MRHAGIGLRHFSSDVTFTVEYEGGLVHPVTTEVVAWRPLNIKP